MEFRQFPSWRLCEWAGPCNLRQINNDMKIKIAAPLVFLALVISACSVKADDKWDISKVDVSKLPPVGAKKDVTYAKDIRPLLQASCFRCHGEEEAKGEMRLDNLDSVLMGGEDGKMVIPGESQKSLLVASAAQIDSKIAMPPKPKAADKGGAAGPGETGPPPKPLTAAQVSLIRAWIDQGAK